MKAYNKCPECGNNNNAKWLKEVTNRIYVTCMCVECNTIYNQLIKPNDNGYMVLKPEHILPVPILYEPGLFNGSPFQDNQGMPVKTVKHTTSQARL